MRLMGVVAMIACWFSTGCDQGQFMCGTPSDITDNETRVCDRATEVCVCKTHSCAVPSANPDCTSGYEYVDRPFAAKGLEGVCVDPMHIGTAIDQRETLSCSGADAGESPDAAPADADPPGADAAVDAAVGGVS